MLGFFCAWALLCMAAGAVVMLAAGWRRPRGPREGATGQCAACGRKIAMTGGRWTALDFTVTCPEGLLAVHEPAGALAARPVSVSLLYGLVEYRRG